jgi:hypothetical protein
MNIKKLSFIILSLLASSAFKVTAQTIEGNLNYFGFMDNREYLRSKRFSQTIFGNTLSPEIGFKLDSFNRFRVGFNALYEFGSQKNTFADKIQPIIYYENQKNNWTFLIGAFPRVHLLDDYPVALLRDSLNYYRPNIEGMLVKYQTEKFKETVWLDWTSRQTNTDKETFLFGFSGKYQVGSFFLNHYAYMYHDAGAGIPIPGDHLQDNGGFNANIGLDLSNKTILDSLTISAGPIFGIERDRVLSSKIKTPGGLISNIYASFRKFSIKNTFYLGEGMQLINGDSFYTSKSYDRVDLGYTPIKYKNLEGKFVFSYHFVDGKTDNQQAFFLRYNISGKKDLKKKR